MNKGGLANTRRVPLNSKKKSSLHWQLPSSAYKQVSPQVKSTMLATVPVSMAARANARSLPTLLAISRSSLVSPSPLTARLLPRCNTFHSSIAIPKGTMQRPGIKTRIDANALPARPKPTSSPSSSSPSPSSTTPDSIPSLSLQEPIVLFEGGAVQSPAMSYLTWFTFTITGVVIVSQLSEHLIWPPWDKEAALAPAYIRYPISGLAGGFCILAGAAFKGVSSKYVTKMVLQEAKNGVPWVTFTTSTPSLLPRHMFQSLPYRLEPRIGRTFSVPLEAIERVRGSALSQGHRMDDNTNKMAERAALDLRIANKFYRLDASGVGEPVKPAKEAGLLGPNGKYKYWLRWFIWKVARGSPPSPKFWSRKAFDDMIPFRRV
ncbi:unnamed protein product [Sympodiomycopsis kandeliae]